MGMPLTALKDVRLRRPSMLTVFSVLLPGATLVAEALALLDPPQPLLNESVLGSMPEPVLVAVGVAIAAGLAFSLGVLNRQIGFRMLGRRPTSWGSDVRSELEAGYGTEAVAAAFEIHPGLVHFFQDEKSDAKLLLSYCKWWIEVHRPQLSVVHHETEINVLVAIPIPALAAPVASARLFGWGLSTLGFGVVAATLAVAAIRGARRRRYVELYDAVRNFVMAQLWAGTEPRVPQRP